MRKVIMGFLLIASVSIFGCAGKVTYTPPIGKPILDNSLIVNKGKDDLWNKMIPAIGKNFYAINNLDKASGIINISYNGEPQNYVDCGYINAWVQNARGKRVYDFPAASAYKEYEIYDEAQGGFWLERRKMNLEGRINIIIEELASDKCKITINCQYILTKTLQVLNYPPLTDMITFNSGQQGIFPQGTCCQPTGKLEKDLLSLLGQTQ